MFFSCIFTFYYQWESCCTEIIDFSASWFRHLSSLLLAVGVNNSKQLSWSNSFLLYNFRYTYRLHKIIQFKNKNNIPRGCLLLIFVEFNSIKSLAIKLVRNTEQCTSFKVECTKQISWQCNQTHGSICIEIKVPILYLLQYCVVYMWLCECIYKRACA